MFAFTLETLVLRGVVRTGELGVARLGFGVKAEPRNPGNPNPVPVPTTGIMRPDTDPLTPDVGYPTKSVSSGAGRSRRHADSRSQSGRIATTAILWWQQLGGQATAAAAKCQALSAGLAAPAGEVSPESAMVSVSTGRIQQRSA
jgi:hypothetical protein